MAKRVLLVLTTNDDGGSATRDAAGVARAAGGTVRVMCVHPLPRPRVDRYDRTVADVDLEMARLQKNAIYFKIYSQIMANELAQQHSAISGR